MADMFETIDTCPVPVDRPGPRVRRSAAAWACAPWPTSSSPSPGRGSGSPRRASGSCPSVISPFVIAKIGESHARALFPGGRRFDATRAAADRAGPRDRRGRRRRSTRRSRPPSPTCSPPGRRRRARRRRSSARCAASATDRRSGTRRGSSPGSGRATRRRKAFAPSREKRRRPGRPIRGDRTRRRPAARAVICDNRDTMSEELSPSQAAARIGATTRSVQRWIASGRLPARRVGGRWRVASDAIDAFVGSRRRAATVGSAPTTPIRTLFIANRGEIATRITRTCDRLGIRAVVPATDGAGRARPARRRRRRRRGSCRRRRRAPSRLRVPRRERRLRRGRARRRDPLGRPAAGGDPGDGRQGRGPPAGGVARRPGPRPATTTPTSRTTP